MSIGDSNIPSKGINPSLSFDFDMDTTKTEESKLGVFSDMVSFDFDSMSSDSIGDSFGSVAPIAQDIISKLKNDIAKIGGEGEIFGGFIPPHGSQEQPEAMALSKLEKLLGSEELLTQHNLGKIFFLHCAKGEDGRNDIRVNDELVDNIERYGCRLLRDDGSVEALNPHDLNVVAWTPEEMARINRVAGQAFTALAQAYAAHNEKAESDDDNRLKDKKFTQITGQKPLVRQDQFPDLKRVKQEQDKIAYMESNRASEDFAAESQKEFDRKTKELDAKADERREYYEVRDQDRETIKQDVRDFELKKDKAA